MDSFLATSLGLCVRLLVDMGSHGDVRVVGSLVGVWEGVVLHHFINKAPTSLDPYLAYGVRLLLDLILTESLSKMMLVMLWTGLGVVASDAVIGPARSRSISARRKIKPRESDINTRVRFHRSQSPLPLELPSDVPVSTHTPQSTTATATPQVTPGSPVLQMVPPTNTLWVGRSIQLGPDLSLLLPPSPISLAPREIPLMFCHSESNALPPHVSHPFEVHAGHMDSPTNATDMNLAGTGDILDADELLAEERCMVLEAEVHSATPQVEEHSITSRAGGECRSEVHHSSEHDHTPTNHPIMLPVPAFVSDPIDPPPPEDMLMTPPPGDTQEDDIDPLPIIIQPVYPVPAFSLNGIEDEATDPAGETTSLDNASVPESEQTQAERESVISTGTRDTLISRGNLLRAQAIAEDKERDRVEMEYKRAVSEGRKKDAILLEGELDKASERAKTLHERAARRYFRAHNLSSKPLTIDVHRLRVPEAKHAIKKAICETLSQDGTHLYIITGRGVHSRGKIPVLKNEIKHEMQRQKIACAESPFNSGLLIVTLPT